MSKINLRHNLFIFSKTLKFYNIQSSSNKNKSLSYDGIQVFFFVLVKDLADKQNQRQGKAFTETDGKVDSTTNQKR